MGFEFLFIHALWALPLAGLPILLHLLFRRKSPVVLFSTLRFVKASIQHTAARRKVQRWLLLACRALLLLLLIWAVAQPARMLASAWFGGSSTIAAIVVDTSYSMLYQEQQVPLLDRASATVEELLRGQLAEAEVAIFRSQPAAADAPERLQPTAALLANWTPLTPQPAPQPLASRITAAVDLLNRQQANQKWLIIISDLQSREFPQPLAGLDDLRVAMIDLHPAEPRAAGITRVSIIPQQPIPGIISEAVIDIAGRAGDSRPLALSVHGADGQPLRQLPPAVVRFDAGGRAQHRIPLELPAQRWLTLAATLQSDDPTAWDNSRHHLLEVPPRQTVILRADDKDNAPALRFIQLALDPSEGRQADWPLAVKRSSQLEGGADAVVEVWGRWPDAAQLARLRDFAVRGGTVMLFLQPGLETTWGSLNDDLREGLMNLLPGVPTAAADNAPPHAATLASTDDPLVEGIGGDAASLGNLLVRRWVAMTPTDPQVMTLLRLSPQEGTSPGRMPLLARRRLGAGRVFTWSTLPEQRFTNLALHPVFLQLLVTATLPPANRSAAQNTEIGEPLELPARLAGNADHLDLESPSQQVTRIAASGPAGGRFFRYEAAHQPGRYTWRDGERIVALAQVELPAKEADIAYRQAEQVAAPADNIVVARSMEEMMQKITQISEPSPRWSWAIALVLLLMCFEALMGSVSHLWKPIRLRSLLSPSASG